MTLIGRSDLYAAFQSSGAMICALEKAVCLFIAVGLTACSSVQDAFSKIVFCCEAVENLMELCKRKQEELLAKRELLLPVSRWKKGIRRRMRENFCLRRG